MKPVRFREEAMAEFLEAIDWYDEQEEGLGQAFNVEVGETLRKLSARPLNLPPAGGHPR